MQVSITTDNMDSPAKQLHTYQGDDLEAYTPEQLEAHMEEIFEGVEDGTINQDDLSQSEYTAIYNWLHGR